MIKNLNRKKNNYLKRSKADLFESILSNDIVDCNVCRIMTFFSVSAFRARSIRRCKKPRITF